jgi:hypothetical protein
MPDMAMLRSNRTVFRDISNFQSRSEYTLSTPSDPSNPSSPFDSDDSFIIGSDDEYASSVYSDFGSESYSDNLSTYTHDTERSCPSVADSAGTSDFIQNLIDAIVQTHLIENDDEDAVHNATGIIPRTSPIPALLGDETLKPGIDHFGLFPMQYDEVWRDIL